MIRTLHRFGMFGIMAATLGACDDSVVISWSIEIDDVAVNCSRVGAAEVAIDSRSGSDDWTGRTPCAATSATVTDPRRAILLGTAGGFDFVSPLRLVNEPHVVFAFGTLASDFLPGIDGDCGPVSRYDLRATFPSIEHENPLTLVRSAACGEPVVLPEAPDVVVGEVLGWVDVGGGDLRACHRLLAPVLVRIEGDPDPVPVPFNPAPEDAAACAPFAPPVPTVCGELQTPEGALALPDGACPKDETQPCAGYENTIPVTGFASGQTLNDLSQLRGVCVNMEHSWMRDLVIYAQCPNGTRVMLSDFEGHTGGEVHLGEPNDNDDAPEPIPGVGWDYCWTPTTTRLPWIPYANANPAQTTLPAGDYQSSQPLSAFVGCPLDGDWTIRVEDRWNLDNGFIFRWSVTFDPSIVDDCENWPN